MAPDPVTELRAAAAELRRENTPLLDAVGALLAGVADRMAHGGWVCPPERNRALKVARAVPRPPVAGAEVARDDGPPPRRSHRPSATTPRTPDL